MIIKFDDELKCWKTPYDTYHFSDTSMNRVLEHMKKRSFCDFCYDRGASCRKNL